MKKVIINLRSLIVLIHDLLVCFFAWCGAYLLRFNFDIPPEHFLFMFHMLYLIIPLQLITIIFSSIHKGSWRFVGLIDLKRIVIAVFLSVFSLVFFLTLAKSYFLVPRSVLIIYPVLLISMMGGGRFLYRVIRESQLHVIKKEHYKPVIIFGARQTGIALAKELLQGNTWRVVGFLDEDRSLFNREISGIKVLGGLENLAYQSKKLNVKNLIIASTDLNINFKREIISEASALGIDLLTVPSLDDLISGRLIVPKIRPINVEDLLGREKVELDNSGLNKLINKSTVVVTGAGGSIGSELCRQILKFQPKQLLCLDISEYSIYKLQQELEMYSISTQIINIVGNVNDALRLNKIFSKYKPKVVFHAAAYKHVPLMENINVIEAFNNNVMGTLTLAKCCKKANVDKFVLVSTDKAVNPTNVMGATKRLAEIVCQCLQDNLKTQFITVRFGNVLGSSGSVIPKFRNQIADGGPITVTHPEITRYFMSIPEAAQLVMQACLMGSGGEIFVLDMSDPIKIIDLAKDMIRLSGYKDDEIKIEFSGLRPGEKLYEELLSSDEKTHITPHPKVKIASARKINKTWFKEMIKWISSLSSKDENQIKEELKNWIKEYNIDSSSLNVNKQNNL